MDPIGRISARRLALVLGAWRRNGSRQGAADLAAAIELGVLDGQLPVGTRLPAERELAEALDVSRTLVAAALDRLREAGLVASRRGAGSWITAPRGRVLDPAPPDSPQAIDLVRAATPAVPGVMAAVDRARLLLVDELGGHGYTGRGLPLLRERIADRYTARGLPTSPAQIMITNGAHHAFVLVLRMLTHPGDRVLVEQPTYPNALEAIRAAHTTPVPVALGEHGWDLAGLEAAVRQTAPRMAHLIVDFHNPTGARLDAAGREGLGALLARTQTHAVVDETFAELDLDGDPLDGPPPLATFAGDWAITVGTASKSHWGGLRIGWIRASEDLVTRLSSSRFASDLGSPVFEQLVVAELLDAGDSVLTLRRADLRAQREALAEAVRRDLPDWRFRVPAGGLSLWCRLPEPMSTRLAVAAANHGVQVAPASRFSAQGGLEHWLRLPYAQPAERLTEAVTRLALAAASVRGAPADDLPVA
ncbi:MULTISPECIES: PLP-dependent aminotransferase family protein [Amycolatopsis]|uniref:PLP-dependent aminotransferase family protein n=1 Tax=Amycolatopsis thermalba TaxID=944492 RepID=A0ABY4NNG8_9PSEU|nr:MULTISPECIES: PLP-dependent aminotransferase family protein [Amycolatopsis]OXM74189.1 GntR family transcriptional regulator [Amycolatopsis sp. KNN50.9b]UQS22143.1 PLP-dependent aminotransferase family protein [Amycolatopsis thermalba]